MIFTCPHLVWFEKRWTRKNNSTWNVDAGLNVRFDPNEEGYIYDYGGWDVNGQYLPVLSMDGDIGNNWKPWLNYNIGGGYSMFLSNYNFLRINLLVNFSATKIPLAKRCSQPARACQPRSSGWWEMCARSDWSRWTRWNFIDRGRRKIFRSWR